MARSKLRRKARKKPTARKAKTKTARLRRDAIKSIDKNLKGAK